MFVWRAEQLSNVTYSFKFDGKRQTLTSDIKFWRQNILKINLLLNFHNFLSRTQSLHRALLLQQAAWGQDWRPVPRGQHLSDTPETGIQEEWSPEALCWTLSPLQEEWRHAGVQWHWGNYSGSSLQKGPCIKYVLPKMGISGPHTPSTHYDVIVTIKQPLLGSFWADPLLPLFFLKALILLGFSPFPSLSPISYFL